MAKEIRNISASVRACLLQIARALPDILGEAMDRAARSATASEMARMFSSGMKGFKNLARDADELRRIIRCLTKTITLALAVKGVAPAAGRGRRK
jgi:hypothetical protein